MRVFWFGIHDTDREEGGYFSLALLILQTSAHMGHYQAAMGIGTAGEGSSNRTSFAITVKRNSERRYGFAIKGNKPRRNL